MIRAGYEHVRFETRKPRASGDDPREKVLRKLASR